MTKFVLHGGFTRRDNELNRTFYKELVKDVPNHGNILLVYFASRYDDVLEVYEEMSMKIQEQSAGKEFSFTQATKEDFMKQLGDADAVYIHGGSTNKLLDVLRTYSDIEKLTAGKTVAGSSAGAYAIAKYGASHSEDRVREGLGLLPIRLACHYESEELPPAEGAMKVLRESFTELELVLLRDFESRVFLKEFLYNSTGVPAIVVKRQDYYYDIS